MTLPKGWAETTIGEVANTKLGKMLDANKNKGELVAYLRNVNVRWGAFDLSDLLEMRVTPDERETLSVRNGDLFMCEGGEPGRCAVWRAGERDLVFQKAIHRVRPLDAVEADYLATHIAHLAAEDSLSHLFTGTTIKHLPQVALQRITLPLPPAAEQRRIILKVEALTASIRRAATELKRVGVLAANLRASSIIAAMRGDLTARWREQHDLVAMTTHETENAYERIAGVRRRKPALPIDWKPEITIPSSWRWASVDEVVGIVQYGTSAKTTDDADGIAVLRMGNIQQGAVDRTKLKYLPASHEKFPALLLMDGDVLFNRTNSPELVGKAAVYRGSEPESFASYLIRVRCAAIMPDLLTRYLNSPVGREWVGEVASQQVGQANVNGTKLRALGVPLPPMAEQIEMNRLLSIAFARADCLEAEAARARALLDRLEAAILAKAFRGELVPQDPNDEPASALLDRIRAERAAAPKPKRGRARKAVG